jgi:hypothetical protein
MSLSGLLEAVITNQDTFEDFVDTVGSGAEHLVNLLYAVSMSFSFKILA